MPVYMNQAFCPKFISLETLDLSHRGQTTMAARTARIIILARGALITSGLVHKKVVSAARTKRRIFEITFKGLKKYPLSAPGKKDDAQYKSQHHRDDFKGRAPHEQCRVEHKNIGNDKTCQ